MPAARIWARPILGDWGMAASDAELALNEMITNAVVHGSGDIRAELTYVDLGARLEVRDAGGTGPVVPRQASPDRPGAHGLEVISMVSTSWGWNQTHAGDTTVWAVVPTTPLDLRRARRRPLRQHQQRDLGREPRNAGG